ncbi:MULTISPECIES: chorismate synthase [Brevibacillus]|jgi:chorismate synthase|uniref:Chorismate synthase n=1 Tax=Brevibacillus borstelensis AK1 TaxID=1300222 RepID=M8DBD4_9BACL|nr:chorismate synthase [Brevibacillus borstelensis]EMT53589.1 chorismate synthase [Brevibacillus borstelensis AK1]KKX53031.1 chorismate synthase [Brevibacillus borstelensis cifa_chp40]MBE5397803.1 chorismate synthase [Brevibacillus borstelensis]MCC0562740.1 chorismate synthase [Brevibacillus borstelensis]MCM3469483.1 chorismate synthase [Brevibacillus borstelensis]
MRYLTAGESHGPQLTAIIEGIPSNLPFSVEAINEQLARRQKGHGRGRRMQIEKDQVKVLSGVRHGYTTGAPITLVVENKDWAHWQGIMSVEPVEGAEEKRRVSRPRPGHADLNGAIKYHQRDMRNILERSSARETTIRVAVGAVARQLLEAFGIRVGGQVLQIGNVVAKRIDLPLEELIARTEESPVRCLDEEAAQLMMAAIDQAKQDGDSLGGIVEVIVDGVPVGLGSHVQWDRKLDGRLAQAVMSIQAFKGVEIGIGFEAAGRPGSQVHDEIVWSEETGYSRKSNRAGGLEGGMTTGMPVVVRGVMKPIPTLYKPLMSVDIDSREAFSASIERSDSCAVPAASVVAEAVVAWEIASAMCEKFPSDSLDDMLENVRQYRAYTEKF